MMFARARSLVAAALLGCCLAASSVQAQALDPNTGLPVATGDTTGADGTASPAAAPASNNGLTNVTSIVGTWSSGSQAVETGLSFFNPVKQEFYMPQNTGVSYSFTDDGFFETSKYRFESNAKTNRCFKASLIWQHGTYTLHPNGSITLLPFVPDGYIQVLDPCGGQTMQMYRYNEFELIPNWYNYQDNHPGFQAGSGSTYAMQLYQFDGQKMPMMFLKYRPPNMLPTQQLFQQVLNS